MMSVPVKRTPRWLVFVFDLIICFFSICFAYFVRFELRFDAFYIESLKTAIPIYNSKQNFLNSAYYFESKTPN